MALWNVALRDIPTAALEPCARAAMSVGPRRHIFGPWDLREAWSQGYRDPLTGKQVRQVL